MAIYYFILFTSVITAKLNNYFKIRFSKSKIEFFFHISIFILLFFAVFRSESIGVDTRHYITYFDNALYRNIYDLPYEPGFNLLTKAFQNFSKDFEIYLSFLSIITLVPILIVLKKESKKYFWLTLFVFVSTQYVSSFSILRGYISLMFLLHAYQYINDNSKKIKFWIYIILAISFHYSAIIYLLLFIFGKKRYKISHYITIIIASIIFYHPVISNWIRITVINILSFIRPQYNYYALEHNSDSSLVYISIYAIIVMLSFAYRNKLEQTKKINVLFNMSVFMLVFNLSMSWFPAYSRLSSGFLIFMSLLIPKIIQAEKDNALKLLYKVVICIIFVIYMKLNLSPIFSLYNFR